VYFQSNVSLETAQALLHDTQTQLNELQQAELKARHSPTGHA
jgi:hypothetical protein